MTLRIGAVCLFLPKASSLTLLTCANGLSRCFFKDNDGYDKAREFGCPTSDDREFLCGRQSQFERAFSLTPSLEGSTFEPYLDGMPCTFSPDTTLDEAMSLKLTDIVITMSDGSTRNPHGATYTPALERNEMITLLTLGRYGFSENLTMESITIKGSTYSGAGLSYTDKGHELAFARWWGVNSHRNLEGRGNSFFNWFFDGMQFGGRNDCGLQFPETTHLIQVVFNGGMTVTFNSNRQLPFNLDPIHHKPWFKVIFGDGSELAADKYLGFADEADGDNFMDICMKLTDDDVQKFAEGSAKVRVISSRTCQFLVLPKGDSLNDLVTADFGDGATESQEICIMDIPGAAAECDPASPSGRYQPYTPTAGELAALQEADCQYITPEKENIFLRNLILWSIFGALIVCCLCGAGCYFYRTRATSQTQEAESEGGVHLTEQ